jgi:HEAT repeat protein
MRPAPGAAGPLVEPVIDPELLRAQAIDMLVAAMADADPLMRANAIEGLQLAPDRLGSLIPGALEDENAGVRFVAAMTVGQLQLAQFVANLRPLLDDESQSVQAGAMFALVRCGQRVDLTPMATMIRSEDPEVRANVAMILGDLGNTSAIPLIQSALGVHMMQMDPARARIVDLQMAEALVKLGQYYEIEVIRAALFTPAEEGEITALACIITGRLRDNRAAANLLSLAQRTGIRQQPNEVRIAATYAIALIDPTRAPVDVVLPFLDAELPQTRIQAVLTLGVIQDPAWLGAVARLMTDEVPLVRVAAAAAALRILTPETLPRSATF